DGRRARGHGHRARPPALRRGVRDVSRGDRSLLQLEAGAVHPGGRERPVRRAHPARLPPWRVPAVIFAGLTLTQLLGIFGAAAVFATALYILKLRRRTVAVPFSKLWEKILRDKEATSLFSKLKRLLSLLVQLAL